MSCQCNANPACADRSWLSSVFDDCFVGSGLSDGLMSGLMGNLQGILVAGSKVRLGFAYDIANYGGSTDPSANDDPAYIREVLTGALLGSGDFESVSVTVQPSAYFGLQDGYILIQGTIYRDKGAPEHIEDVAFGLIREYLPLIDITRRDGIIIDFVPADRTNDSNVAQVNTPADTTPRRQPGEKSLFDSIADALDVTKSTAQLITLGGVALAVVLIAKR
jgi:hypothetical protein